MPARHVVIAIDIPDGRPWWIAHEHPERPVDDYTVWSWDCTPCMLHLVAAARAHGDHRSETFHEHGDASTSTVAQTLTAALAWRAEHGYPDIFNERNT